MLKNILGCSCVLLFGAGYLPAVCQEPSNLVSPADSQYRGTLYGCRITRQKERLKPASPIPSNADEANRGADAPARGSFDSARDISRDTAMTIPFPTMLDRPTMFLWDFGGSAGKIARHSVSMVCHELSIRRNFG